MERAATMESNFSNKSQNTPLCGHCDKFDLSSLSCDLCNNTMFQCWICLKQHLMEHIWEARTELAALRTNTSSRCHGEVNSMMTFSLSKNCTGNSSSTNNCIVDNSINDAENNTQIVPNSEKMNTFNKPFNIMLASKESFINNNTNSDKMYNIHANSMLNLDTLKNNNCVQSNINTTYDYFILPKEFNNNKKLIVANDTTNKIKFVSCIGSINTKRKSNSEVDSLNAFNKNYSKICKNSNVSSNVKSTLNTLRSTTTEDTDIIQKSLRLDGRCHSKNQVKAQICIHDHSRLLDIDVGSSSINSSDLQLNFNKEKNLLYNKLENENNILEREYFHRPLLNVTSNENMPILNSDSAREYSSYSNIVDACKSTSLQTASIGNYLQSAKISKYLDQSLPRIINTPLKTKATALTLPVKSVTQTLITAPTSINLKATRNLAARPSNELKTISVSSIPEKIPVTSTINLTLPSSKLTSMTNSASETKMKTNETMLTPLPPSMTTTAVSPIVLLLPTSPKLIRSTVAAAAATTTTSIKESERRSAKLIKSAAVGASKTTSIKPNNNCIECNKSFTTRANLKVHSRIHTGEKPFACSVCKKSFGRKSVLDKHQLYHTGQRRFMCELCGAGFYTLYSLNRHRSLHTGLRLFVCEVCGSTHVTNNDFKRHLLTHRDVKPFACTICAKTFARKHDLKVHNRYHNNDAQLECGFCGKMFVEESNYRRHLRQHTGERPYKCTLCGISFAQLHHIKKHQKTCQKTFSNGNSSRSSTEEESQIGYQTKLSSASIVVKRPANKMGYLQNIVKNVKILETDAS